MTDYTIKDSGERVDYPSGMRRDVTTGKPDYTLLPLDFLERWAMHMTRGAEKYGRENWALANSQEEVDRFKSSAMRHMIQWLSGDKTEDHPAAIAFNVAAAERTQGKVWIPDPTAVPWREDSHYDPDDHACLKGDACECGNGCACFDDTIPPKSARMILESMRRGHSISTNESEYTEALERMKARAKVDELNRKRWDVS